MWSSNHPRIGSALPNRHTSGLSHVDNTGLVAGVGERCVVGGGFGVGEVDADALDASEARSKQASDVVPGGVAGDRLPGAEGAGVG